MIETLRKNQHERIGSDAFRIEYKPDIPENVLIDDVVSYLGEYRFNLQKYSYTFKFKDGKLRDPHRGESMEDVTQRAIRRHIQEGKSFLRETAEQKGFINLDNQLGSAKQGDTLIWASPPGPKEDGYGDYGFIFIGNVDIQDESGKTIRMTAVRVESPKIEQFNKTMRLLTGEKTDYKSAEEFLANPKILSGHLGEDYVDALLGMSFSFKRDYEEQEEFAKIIHSINPLIKDFMSVVRWGTSVEKVKAFNALENYFLKLKKDYQNSARGEIIYVRALKNIKIKDIVGDFGHKPPVTVGSCGSTKSNELTSSNMFSKGSFLNSLFGNEERFTCPKCGYGTTEPVGNECPNCHITKEQYANESGISCD